MDRFIKRLVRKTSNDQELGAKVRAYVVNRRTCCDNPENHGIYTDLKGNTYDRCKECGKLLNV